VTHTSIFACRDARALHWQLGPLPPANGRLTLLGWTQAPERPDAGVPVEVAHVLASALVSVARVTFPCSSVNSVATTAWSPLEGDLIRVLGGKGIAGRIVAKLTGTPADIGLMSTRQPESAMRLFDDAGFPWSLQGQVVLLSEPGAPPPDISADALLELLEEDWTQRGAALGTVGVQGIMRPGVDGDVAGLLSLRDAFEQALLDALQRETQLAGLVWGLVPETEFAMR
jgi:hypothetical protein